MKRPIVVGRAAIVAVALACSWPAAGRAAPLTVATARSVGSGALSQSAAHAAARGRWRRQIPEIDRNHVLVRFGPRRVGLAARLTDAGVRVERAVPGTRWSELATRPGDAVATRDRLRRDPAIAQVELSYIRHVSTVPNDPKWATAQAAYLGGLRADRAWDINKGAGVVVAVVDSGVDLDHPDLAGRLVAGRNILVPSTPPQDDNGHGTMVAGIIAANANNRRGIAGLAPQAAVMPVKVVDASGTATDPDIAAGVTWARTHGAKVINLSLGGPATSSVLTDAIDAALAANVVVVAAAGNDFAETVEFPAVVPGVLAVSATAHDGSFAAFSSYGWRVDVAAPGLDITSTALGASEAYATESGTSFSSPIVAATAALLRAQNPGWSAALVAQQIRDTARDVGPPGVDAAFGHGIVDPLAALGGLPAAPHPAPRDSTDEPNDTQSLATALPIGVSHNANIAPETDEDWYDVNFTSTGWYSVSVPSAVRTFTHFIDPIVELYDANGAFGASQDLNGGDLVAPIESTGHYFVRVRNRGGDTAPYSIRVATVAAPPAFAVPVDVDVGAGASSAAIADVTGDGRNDVLVTFGDSAGPLFSDTLAVLAQTPTRSFVASSLLGVGAGAGVGMATGDLDGDGLADVAVPTDSGIDVFTQGPDGLPAVPVVVAAGVKASELAIADVDGDTNPDLVAAGTFGIRVYKGPSFNTFTTVTATSSTRTLALGDVNDDGRLDVVTCCVAVYRQAANHTFVADTTNAIANAADVAIGDLNDDTKPDIVATLRRSASPAYQELLQSGGALQAAAAQLLADPNPEPVAVADFDQDGRDDVVLLHDSTGDAVRLQQLNNGQLGNATTFNFDDFQSHYDARALAVGDVDSDGYPDVAVATSFGLAVVEQNSGHLPALAHAWAQDVVPAALEAGVASAVMPTVTLGRDATNVDGTTAQLVDANGTAVAAVVAYNAGAKQISITPNAPLADGRYVIRVKGLLDPSGNSLADYASPFTVGPALDETPPQTTLHAPPSGFRTVPGASLTFSANEPGSFLCSLDNAAYTSCSSPRPVNVAIGVHTFKVFARDTAGNEDASPAVATWTYRPVPHGYWMLGSRGAIYHFGTVSGLGNPTAPGATDLAATPSGYGYWIVDARGHVFGYGDAAGYGNAGALAPLEIVTSISRTASGRGYWLFTSRGRVFARGDAHLYGDMSHVALNGAVVDSVSTPSGKGYFMVGSDGGVFGFGDAKWAGSTGSRRIPAPIRTLVPDPDGTGYWLAGTDGSVYPFAATARGSMAGTRLNRPIVGMVAFGNGYLMIGADGGIFAFSNRPFYGSLASHPPAIPIVSVAAYG